VEAVSWSRARRSVYPRGNQTVTGPSIRLAEELARDWGNLDFGIVELEQRDGDSEIMAYCWDLETNSRQTKIFTVPHERHTKRGVTKLTDPRDIYELTANQGARRLRACILGVIPGDITEAAVKQCEKTLASGNDEPLVDRLRQMIVVFADLGVTQEMIVGKLGHSLEAVTEIELVSLRKIYTSLRDNMSQPADWFGPTEVPATNGGKMGFGGNGGKMGFGGNGGGAPKPPDTPQPPPADEPDPGTKAAADRQVEALKDTDGAEPAAAPEEAPIEDAPGTDADDDETK